MLTRADDVSGLRSSDRNGLWCSAPRLRGRAAALGALVALIAAGHAKADPCEARVSGYKPGATVAGTIRYVGDGDGLCIGVGPDPGAWTEIRLADIFAPELNEPGGRAAKAALERFLGRRAVCTAVKGMSGSTRSYDRLIARCRVDGKSLASLLREGGAPEGGRGR